MHELTVIPEGTVVLFSCCGGGFAGFEVATGFGEEVGFVVVDVLGSGGGVEGVEG
jgi:hypothetical protein